LESRRPASTPRAVERALGRRDQLLPIELDVTDERQARAGAKAALERFGQIDVLVNNAGRGLLSAVEEASADEVRSAFAGLGRVDVRERLSGEEKRRVPRENAKIPQKMQSRRWHRGHQASEQIERFERERARAVSPDLLQLEFEPTVRATRQAL
jgi:hypothetical protein